MAPSNFQISGILLLAFCSFTQTDFCSDCQDKVGVPCTITAMNCSEVCSDQPDDNGLKPGKVEDASVKNILLNGSLGFNISFSLPRDGSRKELRGFVVDVMRLQDHTRKCYCVNIKKAHCILDDVYPMVHVDCSDSWQGEADFSIVIQSLPVTTHSNYVVLRHKVTDITDPDPTDPCQWQMSDFTYQATSDSKDGPWELKIDFAYAPHSFKFRKYFFVLMSDGESQNCTFSNFIQDEKHVENYDLDGSHGTIMLKTPYNGEQCIKITATCGEDRWWNCDNLEHCMAGPITRVRMGIYDKRMKRTRTRALSPALFTNLVGALSKMESCEADDFVPEPNLNLAAIVVPTVSIVLIIVAAGTFLLLRKQAKSNGTITLDSKLPSSGLTCINQQVPPTVLLIYSNDFKEHETVILKLAKFLCKCRIEILCNLLDCEASENQFAWMINALEKAQKVLIIHSLGTFKRYNCMIIGKKLNDKKPAPDPDIFDNFVRHYISKYHNDNNWEMSKFINARFDYSDGKYVIVDFKGQSRTYVLPEHLKDLVANFYGTTSHSEEFHLHDIDWVNYHIYDIGAELKTALDDAKRFIKEQPKWSVAKYGDSCEYESVSYDKIIAANTNTTPEGSSTTEINDESTQFDSGVQDVSDAGTEYTSLSDGVAVSLQHSFNAHEHECQCSACSPEEVAPEIYENFETPAISTSLNNEQMNLHRPNQDFHPPDIMDDTDDTEHYSKEFDKTAIAKINMINSMKDDTEK